MNTSRFTKKLALLAALALITSALAISVIFAQEAMDAPERSTQEQAQYDLLYRVADEELTQGDLELTAELLDEDFVMHSPLGDLDREGFIGFIQALRGSLSDFTVSRELVITEGAFASTRTTITGTFDLEAFVTPLGVLEPNGEAITVPLQTFHRFNDAGLFAEEWVQFDLLSFFTQLGAFPAPEA